MRATTFRKVTARKTMRCCTSHGGQASLTIVRDGPSRMVKRPTESGGEPSSSNCGASAGVKARQLTHCIHDTFSSPLSALRLAGAGHGATSPPRISHRAGQPGARTAGSDCRAAATCCARFRSPSGPHAAPRSGLPWPRHLFFDRRSSSFVPFPEPQLEWPGARRWRLRARRRGSQVQLI